MSPVNDGDQRARMDAAKLDACEVVVAFAIAGVDRVVMSTVGLDHLAERRESLTCQRFGRQGASADHGQSRNLGWRFTSL